MDIYPGDTEQLDMVVRYADEDDCYGWTNEFLFRDRGRLPEWRLARGIFLAKVTRDSCRTTA